MNLTFVIHVNPVFTDLWQGGKTPEMLSYFEKILMSPKQNKKLYN